MPHFAILNSEAAISKKPPLLAGAEKQETKTQLIVELKSRILTGSVLTRLTRIYAPHM